MSWSTRRSSQQRSLQHGRPQGGGRRASCRWTVRMMPSDGRPISHTHYGIEGLAALWKEDSEGILCSGGVFACASSRVIRSSKKVESSAVNQLARAQAGQPVSAR